MNRTSVLPLIAAGLLTVASGFSAPVKAQAAGVSISQEPLYVTNRIKPAFIMAVDDSGSMAWEVLFPTFDGQATWRGPASSFFHPTELGPDGRPRFYRSGEAGTNGQARYLELFPFNGRSQKEQAIPPIPNFGFARSHDWNPAYFNPFVNYGPWARADRSEWPQATAAAVVANPRAATSATNPTFNLTADVQQDGNNWRFNVRVGMRIPAGTVYSRNTGNTCDFGGTQIGTTGWWTVATDFVANANCQAGFRYYPATFYLSSPTFPGYTAEPLAIVNPAGGPPGTTLYRYEIKPGNMTAAAYSTTMQNFANWFQYYRDRNLSMVAAMTRAFVDVDFMRVGYFRINNRNTVTMYDMGIQADRNAFYNLITALPASGSTPNRISIQHLGEQFKRTGTGAPVQLACQMNAGMLFTDGYSNQDGPVVGNLDGGMGAPFADNIANKKSDIVANYYLNPLRSDLGLGQVRVSPACAGPNPDPRLDCRTDPHMNFYGVTLGALGTVYGVNAAATADPFANPPVWPGRCDNCLEAVDELWQATLTGRGRYINAKNPQAVSQAMIEVVNAVLDSTQPVGTPPVSSPRISSDSATFQTSFAARNNARDWTGNVEGFRVNRDGSIGTLLWNAESALPAAGLRNILAMRTPGTSATRNVVPFQASSFGTTESDRANAIGVSLASFTANFEPGLAMADAYAYLRGVRAAEQPTLALGFRQRSGVIGSIINSPAEVETKRTFYSAFDSGTLGESYRTYLAQKRANFSDTVFVGANAGMLHAFDAVTGVERFAYIPNGALSQMGLLLNRNYQHRYFVDGKINVTDAVIGGSWGTVLLGNMGRGGRSVFAINVTNPASVTPGQVMWELSTSDNDLGFALGRVEVMHAENGNWYAVFANGLNSPNGNPVLYIVDLTTGAITRKLVAEDGGDLTNGLTQIALADVDRNGRTDTIYGGDFQGNVWKFDLSSASTASWGVGLAGQPLFVATDAGGNRQSITGKPAVSRGPSGGAMVYVGTGRYLSDTDAVSGGTQALQTFYGVWDRGSGGLTRASLQAQTITGQFGSGASIGRTLSNNRVNYAAQRGWYVDLKLPGSNPTGERFIGDPRIIGGTISFTTSEPSGDTQCAPGLKSLIYRLDRLSGAPVLDRMERSGGAQVCAAEGCGALQVSNQGAPVLSESIIQPQRPCRRGIDAECPAIADPEVIAAACGSPDPTAGNFNANYDACVANEAAGESGASLRCSAFGDRSGGEPQVCGRQSWRQVR